MKKSVIIYMMRKRGNTEMIDLTLESKVKTQNSIHSRTIFCLSSASFVCGCCCCLRMMLFWNGNGNGET